MKCVPALLLLAACDAAKTPEPEKLVGVAAPCAVAGAAEFTSTCRVARAVVEGRTVLTLIAPDGGFHRVEVAADGSGVAAADGAEPARTRRGTNGEIEVAIAQDRYRLPAAAP